MTWPSNNPISRELDDFWKESQSLIQQWWYEADLDTKMATGQQDYWNTFYNINYRNQKVLMFNKILRILNMIDGYQRDNRLATIIRASDNDPDGGETAEQRSTVLDWVKRKDQTYEKISDCFNGSNTCGLNLLHTWVDFREDPESGTIRSERLPFNSFVLDPFCKPDLSNANRIWTRKYLTPAQLISLVPDIKNDLPAFGKGYAAKDGKFQFLAQNWAIYNQEMYAYDEYWTRTYRTGRKLLDTRTGEVAEWKGTREQFRLLRQHNPNIELIKAQIPTVKWHVLVNNNLVYEEEKPYGLDRMPFSSSVCYAFPEVQNYAYRYQGIVRNIRDSQIELNRRRNRLLDMLDAQIQSGLHVKEDALVNPEDAFFQGPGKVLFFKQTANLATDVVTIPGPPVAPGWMELIQSIEKEIMDIVGPEELFAQNMSAQDMSGVMMKLKMGAGLTGLRNVFDRLNQFQMNTGEIMDDLIVNNFSQGKVARILGKEPTEHFFSNEFSRFNCIVDEASMTSTQKQYQFLQAMQMRQMGVPISNEYLVEKSTLQDKKGVVEDIKKQEQQAQQLQQAQQQAELEQQRILTRSYEAQAQNNFAAAEERKARAVSDIALAQERSSQAIHDKAGAALENAKAFKELDEMDENRLMKLAKFVLDVQSAQSAIAAGEEQGAVQEASSVGSEVKQEEAKTKTQ